MASLAYIILFVIGINGVCIKDGEDMMCTNEFKFDLYSGIRSLTLINSYITNQKMKSSFQNLDTLTVSGIYAQDMCEHLTDIKIYGCDGGM